jgi:peptidoglycan/LPS O-acetylase OafA/YrhL
VSEASGTSPARPAPPELRTLAQTLVGHDNAFGFIRLFLATLVLLDHAYPLGGFGPDPLWAWSGGQESFGGLAVAGFFIVSGYLITKSALGADALQYLWRRGLRILPAYWVVLLVAALGVAPVAYWADHHTLRGFFAPSDLGPKAYVVENFFLSINRYCIHDLFAANTPYGIAQKQSVFNGSLWTLIYEWRCYLLVVLLSLGGVLRRARPVVVALVLALFVLFALHTADLLKTQKLIAWLVDPYTVRFTLLFLFGGVAALYAASIPLDDRLGVACCALVVFTLRSGGYFLLGLPAMAYALLWLAVRLPRALRQVGAKDDYSYGTYLYGFLVQQVLARLGLYRHGVLFFTAASIAVTYAAAFASWQLIEKPAMKLKDWGPGRGLAALAARLPGPLKALPFVRLTDR